MIETKVNVSFKKDIENENSLLAVFSKKFTLYQIETEFDDETKFLVERRMSDFERLWRLLKENYPAQIIPPLPECSFTDRLKEQVIKDRSNFLKLALQAALTHPLLQRDEYLKCFLSVEKFEEILPMIRNIEVPLVVEFKSFKEGKRGFGFEFHFNYFNNNTPKLPLDLQYQRILEKVEDLVKLKEKLEKLFPLLNRLNFERGEVSKGAQASLQVIKHLLFMSKAHRIDVEDHEGVNTFLNELIERNDDDDDGMNAEYFIRFAVRYIESISNVTERHQNFRKYLAERREEVSELAKKLDLMQMPVEKKPAFDQIFQSKLRHEKLLEGMAVLEVTYEKFSELLERDLQDLEKYLKKNLDSKLGRFYRTL